MEAFFELPEARAELGDIHLMTFNEHMMFHMRTGVQYKGMLTAWRRIENPTMTEMKCVMKIYMNAKKQKKATRNCPKENARAAKAGEKNNRGRSPSRGRMSIPKWKGLSMRCAKPNHIKSKCTTKREDVKCGNCNHLGHVSDVCLDKHYKKSAQSTCSSSAQKQTVRCTQTQGPAPQQKQQSALDPTPQMITTFRCLSSSFVSLLRDSVSTLHTISTKYLAKFVYKIYNANWGGGEWFTR